MKYIVIIAVLVAGAWYYKGNVGQENEQLSISQRIAKNGYVEAGLVLSKSKEMVNFICNDDEALRSWGSNSDACFARASNFGEMCEERIFPDKSAAIKTDAEAKKLISRYNKCVIPS